MYTKNRKRKLSVRAPFLAIGFAGAISLAASVASAQDRCYSTIDLGVIDSSTPEAPFGINNQNQAVFSVNVGGGTPKFHAMLYLPAPAYGFSEPGLYDLHDLANIPEAESSVAHDINENGIVVGYRTYNLKKHAFIWRLESDPHEFIDMGTFPGGYGDESEAFAINDDPIPWIDGDGRSDGDCNCDGGSDPLQLAFAITLNLADDGLSTGAAATLIADLGLYHLPDCHRNSTAFDVNTSLIQRVVGNSASGGGACLGGTTRATEWSNINLGQNNNGAALPLLDIPRSLARGISNLGPIVGSSTTSEAFLPHAVYWDIARGPIVDLGSVLPGNPRSNALRINNLVDRDVVGNAITFGPNDGAALWECSVNCDQIVGNNWSVIDLGDAMVTQRCSDFWQLKGAYDVNDTGHIIAWGWHNSAWRAVILVPREPCCPADLDGNGTVGNSDLLILFANWSEEPPLPIESCFADLDHSDTVATGDLLILLANWGPCGEAGGGGGSPSLQAAVQQLGFPSVAAHQAWLAHASDGEAYASTYVLITILQDQDEDEE